MADFSGAQINTGVESPTGSSPVQPAQSGIEMFANVFSALAPSGQQMADWRKDKAKQAAFGVLEDYNSRALKIAEAVDLGEMSSKQARMRLRKLYSETAANNPSIMGEIAEVHKNIIGTSGLGKVVAEGTEDEKRQSELITKAVDRGWAPLDASPEEQLQAAERMREFDLNLEMLSAEQSKISFANAELENMSKHLSIKNSRASLANAEIDRRRKLMQLDQEKSKFNSRQTFTRLVDNFVPNAMTKAMEFGRRAQGAASPQERQEIMQEWKAYEASTVGAIIQQMGPEASTASIDALLRPLRGVMENTEQVISGKQNVEFLQNEFLVAQNQSALNVIASSDQARVLMGTSKVLGESALATSMTTNGIVIEQLAGIGQGETANLESPNTEEVLTEHRKWLDAAASGRVSEASVQEIGQGVNAILDAVSRGGADRAENLTSAANYFASDEFGAYVEKTGGAVSAERREEALDVFTEAYERELIPQIRERWEEATYKEFKNIEAANSTPSAFSPQRVDKSVRQNVEVVFTGSGVRFKATTDMTGLGKATVNRLNSEVAPVVNKLIRMGAHLEGNRKYRAYFDKTFKGIFDERGREEVQEGDAE